MTVEAEEVVFSDVYSNTGSTPMWCYGNTLIVRAGEKVFVSATESLPQFKPLKDCRWVLMKRTLGGGAQQQSDEKGRQRGTGRKRFDRPESGFWGQSLNSD